MLSTLVNDQLYRDVFCKPSSFPTSRFRQWLQIYNVDLEITDPDGRRLSEATFPGCGCQQHQAMPSMMTHGGLVTTERRLEDLVTHKEPVNLIGYQDSSHDLSTEVYSSQPAPDLELTAPITVPVPGPVVPVVVDTTPQTYSHRRSSRGGAGSGTKRGRGGRQPGRGRGHGTKRKSPDSGCSHPQSEQHSVGDVVSAMVGQQTSLQQQLGGSSTGETADCCHDDSAVVEFLASLQSDAAKRRQLITAQQCNTPDPAKPRDSLKQRDLDPHDLSNTRDPNRCDPVNPHGVDPRDISPRDSNQRDVSNPPDIDLLKPHDLNPRDSLKPRDPLKADDIGEQSECGGVKVVDEDEELIDNELRVVDDTSSLAVDDHDHQSDDQEETCPA